MRYFEIILTESPTDLIIKDIVTYLDGQEVSEENVDGLAEDWAIYFAKRKNIKDASPYFKFARQFMLSNEYRKLSNIGDIKSFNLFDRD